MEPRGGVQCVLVQQAVAILIQIVANLAGTGVPGGVLVVAVTTDRHEIQGLVTVQHGGKVVSESITVSIMEPGGGIQCVLVQQAVAILINIVADLAGAGVS